MSKKNFGFHFPLQLCDIPTKKEIIKGPGTNFKPCDMFIPLLHYKFEKGPGKFKHNLKWAWNHLKVYGLHF